MRWDAFFREQGWALAIRLHILARGVICLTYWTAIVIAMSWFFASDLHALGVALLVVAALPVLPMVLLHTVWLVDLVSLAVLQRTFLFKRLTMRAVRGAHHTDARDGGRMGSVFGYLLSAASPLSALASWALVVLLGSRNGYRYLTEEMAAEIERMEAEAPAVGIRTESVETQGIDLHHAAEVYLYHRATHFWHRKPAGV